MAAHARVHPHRHRGAKNAAPPAPASAALVMAGGIFLLGPLRRIPGGPGVPTDILALALIAIWAVLVWLFGRAIRAGQLPGSRPAGNFAMGTWVAATAIVAETTMRAFPGLRPLAIAFALLATGLWGWFLWIAASGVRELLDEHGQVPVTGTVLLTTVSTQSLVLAWQNVLPSGLPLAAARALLAVGMVFYLVGAALTGFGLTAPRTWTFVADWRAPRCILHGAISITGLAALRSHAVGWPVLVGLWLLAAALFVVVEGMEVIRLRFRVRAHGWRPAVIIYHPAQWARNFTFGMFYTFTLALARDRSATVHAPWAAEVWGWLVDWGQYAVLALLVAEAALLLAFLSHARWLAGRQAGIVHHAPRSSLHEARHHRARR